MPDTALFDKESVEILNKHWVTYMYKNGDTGKRTNQRDAFKLKILLHIISFSYTTFKKNEMIFFKITC